MPAPARFRLIDGGRRPRWFGPTRVEIGPRPSFPIAALAVEDDGYFVLAAPAIAAAPVEHPVRLWNEVWQAEPAPPGSLVVRPGRPLALHAVVHDLARDPTWRASWVAAALAAVLREIDSRGLGGLGLEPLGMVHGRLRPRRFAELLTAALREAAPGVQRAIWLIADGETRAALESALDGEGPR